MDATKLAELVIKRTREFVQPAIDSLVDQLESVSRSLRRELDERIAALPVPKDGEPGVAGKDGSDGKSVTLEDVQPIVSKAVEVAIAALPVPRDGLDGIAGKDGSDGVNGTDGKSVTPDDILPTVKAWFDALPPPASGKNGADGKSVTVDDIAEFMESSIAKWALDFERRAQDLLQRAIERIPAPKDGADGINGKDGRDALDIDGFDAVLEEDGRTVTLSLSRGDTRIERKLMLPHVIYRGIYRPEETYQRGDSVTFGGSTWIKCTDAAGKPGEDSAGWKLAVKTGRNGKSAYDLARGNGFIGSEREWLESLKAKKDNPSSVVKR